MQGRMSNSKILIFFQIVGNLSFSNTIICVKMALALKFLYYKDQPYTKLSVILWGSSRTFPIRATRLTSGDIRCQIHVPVTLVRISDARWR